MKKCEAVSAMVHRCGLVEGHSGPHLCDWLKADRMGVCHTEWEDVPVGTVEVRRGPSPWDHERGEQ